MRDFPEIGDAVDRPVMPRVTSLSLAAPAFNEAASLETVIEQWLQHLRAAKIRDGFEIVVCNDGSRDATGTILDRMAAANAELRPVHHTKNQGAAAALTTAIARTTREWVLLIDSDGQFPIENLDRMVETVETKDTRAVMGVRAKKDSLFARFGTGASGAISNLVHGTRLRDFNSAFKLVEGSLLRKLNLEAKSLNYSTEITSKLLEGGVSLIEIDIEHRPRAGGKSSMRLVRDSCHRFIFVFYIALRQLMLRMGILQRRILEV
jgi:dolichol-phosphate mannosyltransferase